MKQTNTPTESREDWEKRFDKEFTCIVTYEKWPDEEEQRLREPQYKFKDFPNTNPKIIKNFLHSELEKVRQETRNCKGQHNFVLSQTINEPFGSGTGFKTFYYVICTKCGK